MFFSFFRRRLFLLPFLAKLAPLLSCHVHSAKTLIFLFLFCLVVLRRLSSSDESSIQRRDVFGRLPGVACLPHTAFPVRTSCFLVIPSTQKTGRQTEFRAVITGLPQSASWQDLKDHMRKVGATSRHVVVILFPVDAPHFLYGPTRPRKRGKCGKLLVERIVPLLPSRQ